MAISASRQQHEHLRLRQHDRQREIRLHRSRGARDRRGPGPALRARGHVPKLAHALRPVPVQRAWRAELSYSALAYLSDDDGKTSLGIFNNSSAGGDRGDWRSSASTRDVQDAFLYPGIKMRLTRADLIGLDLIGYDVPPTLTVSQARLLNQPSDPNYFFVAPEPDAIGLLAAGIGGLALCAGGTPSEPAVPTVSRQWGDNF